MLVLIIIIINLRLFFKSVLLLLRNILANNGIHSEGQFFCQIYIIYATFIYDPTRFQVDYLLVEFCMQTETNVVQF